MKLEQYEERDVAAAVAAHLAIAGLEEMASFIESTGEGAKVYVATDIGLYVGDYGDENNPRRPSLSGSVTSWAEVRRVWMALSGFGGTVSTVTLKIGEPDVTVSGTTDSTFNAVVELAKVCQRMARH